MVLLPFAYAQRSNSFIMRVDDNTFIAAACRTVWFGFDITSEWPTQAKTTRERDRVS